MDINNGEIYAIVSLPDYDNNNVNYLSENQKFNKATKGIYELGSTFKIFTVAQKTINFPCVTKSGICYYWICRPNNRLSGYFLCYIYWIL